MATIQLIRPAAGSTQIIPSAPDGRYVFNFPADAATLSKNGDNLVLTFEDGAAIEIQDFYKSHNAERMPSFTVDGAEIAGQDFFAALDDELSPAAGPGARASAQSGRYNEWGNSELQGGLSHLDGLDTGFENAAAAISDGLPVTGVVDTSTADAAPGAAAAATAADGAAGTTPDAPLPPVAVDDVINEPIMGSLTYNLLGNDIRAASFGQFRDAAGNPLTPDASGAYQMQYGSFVIDADNNLVYTPDAARVQAAYDAMLAESESGGAKPSFVQGEQLTYSVRSADGLESNFATVTLTPGTATGDDNGAAGGDVAWAAAVDNGAAFASGGGDDTFFVDYNRGIIDGGDGGDVVNVRRNLASGVIDSGEGADVINVGYKLPTSENYYGNTGLINAGGGDDTIHIGVYGRARGGNWGTVNGGEGNDVFDVAHAGENSVLNGDAGDDYFGIDGHHGTIRGGAGSDTVHGWLNTGLVDGGGDDDIVTLGNNTGTVDGGKGDDSITVATNTKTINGSEGKDTISVTTHSGVIDGGEGRDSITVSGNHGAVRGGADNDVITVNSGAGSVQGNEGNDTVYVNGGRGRIEGNEGNDWLYAQGAAKGATLDGGAGDDSLWAQNNAHDNELYGGAGEDKMTVEGGSAHHNTLKGGADGDALYAHNSAHDNLLQGEAGDDVLQVEGPNSQTTRNTLEGGAGADTLHALGSVKGNTLDGGSDNDELYAKDYVTGNTLYGREGDDSLYAQDNAKGNTLDGGTGSDTMFAEKNANGNELKGGDDGDRMYARDNAASNTLYGDAGNDLLAASGNAANNSLYGGAGADTLIVSNTDVLRNGPYSWSYGGGTTKSNVLDGGEGNDVLLSVNNTSSNTLKGGAGDDQLFTDALPESFKGIPGVTNSSVYSNAVHSGMGPQSSVFEGNAGNDTLYIRGTSQNNTFYGNDAMEAAAANAHATVPGGESDDDVFRIFGTAQNNVLYGQGGNDTFELCTDMDRVNHANTMYGGTGDDLFVTHVKYPTEGSHAGVTRASLMDGGEGNDTFIFHHKFGGINAADTQGANTVLGGAGDDVIIADSYMLNSSQMSQLTSYNNIFDGGEGNDYLLAGGTGSTDYFQNNTMSGGTGNDVLVIRGGYRNTYEGGDGNDVIDASKGLFGSKYDGGEGHDLLLAQNSTGIETLNNIEAIVIKGASQITGHFHDKLLTGISNETDAYGWNRGHTEIDPTKVRMTQEDVRDVLGDMGFSWQDNGFAFDENQWSRNDGGDRTINGNDYQQWDSADGSLSILVATQSVLQNGIFKMTTGSAPLDGGMGIDVMLSENMTMEALLSGGKVENMEVFIHGKDALSLTGIKQLADDYGITLTDADNDGNADAMTLDTNLWARQADGSFSFQGGADLTLEVNSAAMQEQDGGGEQQAVFLLNNGG